MAVAAAERLQSGPVGLWSGRMLAIAAGALGLTLLGGATVGGRAPAAPGQSGMEAFAELPVAAQAAISETLGRDSSAYRARAAGGVVTAANVGHGLAARFDAGGVQVRAGGERLGLALRAVGRGSTLRPVAAAAPAARANRVSYRRGALTEWYVNGPLGLQQGFTLARPPAGSAPGPLTLSLVLSGSLAPVMEPGNDGVRFAGSTLRYSDLAAYDARGRELPAWLELDGRSLLVRLRDRSARYPLTIDPFVKQARLAASDAATGAGLGASVAIAGNTVVAGAPLDNVGGNSDQGSVYVFVKPPAGWASGTETAKLTASDGEPSDRLGQSVAIAGDTIVAGAPLDQVGPNDNQGAAYVFVEPARGWTTSTETAKLTASDGAVDYWLGWSVAVAGTTVVAGAPGDFFADVSPGSGAMCSSDRRAGGRAGRKRRS